MHTLAPDKPRAHTEGMIKPLFLLVALACALPLSAQSARQLTRKVAPAPAHPPVQRANPGVPASAQPAAPVNQQQVKAQQSQTERNLVEYHKKRAEAGSSNAQFELGSRYLTGKGVDKDEKEARKWLQKSAKGGHAGADKKLRELGWPKEDPKETPAKTAEPTAGASEKVAAEK